jgi:hypothetical protein
MAVILPGSKNTKNKQAVLRLKVSAHIDVTREFFVFVWQR